MPEDSLENRLVAPAPFRGGAVFDFVNAKPMARNEAQNGYLATAGAAMEDILDIGEDEESIKLLTDPKLKGRTVQEVITIQQARKAMKGDQAAINAWQDRVIGKPKQSIEAVSVGLSFTEYLNMLATGNETQTPETTTVNVTPDAVANAYFQELLEEV